MFAGGLFAEAALYATNADVGPGGRFQERYLFTLLPLLVLAFGVSLRRAGNARLAVALLAGALVAISARFPLSGWTDEHGRQDSPFLMGVFRLEESIGYANGSLAVAVVVAALAAGAVAIAYRPRLAAPALVAVGALLAAVAAGAWTLDAKYAGNARASYFPDDARWIDHAGLDDVTMVNTPGSRRELALEQMFWNRSVTRLVRLRGAGSPDVFATPQARIGDDGTLFVAGRPLRKPLLVNEYAVTAEFAGAESVRATPLFELWKPLGTPRLRLLAGGRFFDGWLANSGYVRVWKTPGTLVLRLALPEQAPATRVTFRDPDPAAHRHGLPWRGEARHVPRRRRRLDASVEGPAQLSARRSPGERAGGRTAARSVVTCSRGGPGPPAATRASSACCSRSGGSARG